jgi:hypothetical protein
LAAEQAAQAQAAQEAARIQQQLYEQQLAQDAQELQIIAQYQAQAEAQVAVSTVAAGRTRTIIDAESSAASSAATTPTYYSDPQYTATQPVNVRIAPTSTQSDPTVTSRITTTTTAVSPVVNYTVNPSADLQLAIQQLDNQPFIGIPVQPPRTAV